MPERISRDSFRDKRGADAEHGSDEDYYPEDAYSPWKKGNTESFMANLSKSSGLLIVIIGVGVFILLAVFVFLPMLRGPADTKPIAEMDAKLKKMEAKLSEIEQNYQKVAQLALQEDKIDQVSVRLDKLGASTMQRLDQMSRELDTIHKQSAQVKTDSSPKQPAAQGKTEQGLKLPAPLKIEGGVKQTAAPRTESAAVSKPVETPEKKVTTVKYHEVKPKETLYGIGRTYGVSVDELRRLNNMGPAGMARTGQKLKVSQ
jgi:LysM repeat protein